MPLVTPPEEPSLIRIVRWAQRLLVEVLAPGDTAVDLTAGNGADTLFLARQVGPAGRVLAFDIQLEALRHTAARLAAENIPCSFADDVAPVRLIHDSHARLERYLETPARAIAANLGYLPGGDAALITRAETTRAALEQALAGLAVGGRLAVVVYLGHAGGEEECRVVEELLQGLSSRHWHVLRLQVVNRAKAPYLLVAERRQ